MMWFCRLWRCHFSPSVYRDRMATFFLATADSDQHSHSVHRPCSRSARPRLSPRPNRAHRCGAESPYYSHKFLCVVARFPLCCSFCFRLFLICVLFSSKVLEIVTSSSSSFSFLQLLFPKRIRAAAMQQFPVPCQVRPLEHEAFCVHALRRTPSPPPAPPPPGPGGRRHPAAVAGGACAGGGGAAAGGGHCHPGGGAGAAGPGAPRPPPAPGAGVGAAAAAGGVHCVVCGTPGKGWAVSHASHPI